MDGFISKPFEEKAFWLVVDRLLGLSAEGQDRPQIKQGNKPSDDQD
jgi:hypothetical protein